MKIRLMIRKSLIVISLLFIVIPQSYADKVSNLKISEIYAGGYGYNGKQYTRIKLTANHANPNGCNAAHYIVISKTDENYNQMFAVAMSALLSGYRLNAYIPSCTGDGKFPNASRLSIKQ